MSSRTSSPSLLAVGIAKGLRQRAFPPRVAALVGGSVPAVGLGVFWLLLHQPWTVLAVLAALAVLCAVTRTARSHAWRERASAPASPPLAAPPGQ